MRLSLSTEMLEMLSEGVVLLNHQGHVVKHNAAAGGRIAQCKEKRATLKVLIDQVVSGRVQLPVKLNFFAQDPTEGAVPANAWLGKDGLQGYVLIISPLASPVTSPEVAEKRFVSLMGDEVRARIRQLRDALQTQVSCTGLSAEALAAQCAQLDTLLGEISDLSMLSQREHPFDDARLEMEQLIRDSLPQLQQHCGNPFVFKVGAVRQGVLYGNAPWLSYALQVLLSELGKSSPPGSQVDICLHQLGGFLVLTGNVAGRYTPVAVRMLPDVAAPPPDSGAADQSTRMVMAQRIFALHYGKLKLQPLGTGSAQSIESFTLTLPTGISANQRVQPSCSECPIAQQAELYAQDIGALLSSQ